MKRSTVLLFSCLALAGSAWLAHVVWGQTAETKEKTYYDHEKPVGQVRCGAGCQGRGGRTRKGRAR